MRQVTQDTFTVFATVSKTRKPPRPLSGVVFESVSGREGATKTPAALFLRNQKLEGIVLFQKGENGISTVPENLSDNILRGNGSDNTAVCGVVPVITHHKEAILRNRDGPEISVNSFLSGIVPDLRFAIHVQYPTGNFDDISGKANNTLNIRIGTS